MRVLIPVIAGATQIFVLFRPVLNGTNYGWEPLYKIGAAAWIAIRPIAGTEQSGNFPIGYYNGNQRVDVVAEGGLQGGDVGIGLNMVIAWPKTCDAVVVATGAYDNAYVDITALAVATPFPKRLQWGFSPVSDRYATGGTMGIPGGELITNEFRHLLQTRCNSADLFGFYSGGINVATNMITTGIVFRFTVNPMVRYPNTLLYTITKFTHFWVPWWWRLVCWRCYYDANDRNCRWFRVG